MTGELSLPGRVLGLLLAGGGRASGQEMGQRLGVSRAAVGKAVESLRGQGFVITARPRTGYCLEAEPTPPLPARLEARLPAGCLGLPLLHYQDIDSTNLQARRLAEAGAPHGACLVAEHQSAGRGRLDRRWQAPAGACLLFSLLLRPAGLPLAEVFSLTNLAALAVCQAIEQTCGLAPAIKWPNDVFLEGRKLAGILTEFTARAERLDYVVVGVGLNVNLNPDQLAKLPAPANSLLAASGRSWDRALVLAAILQKADALYARLMAGGREVLGQEYNRRSWLTGRQVTVRDGDQVRQGLARGVAPDGALLLEEAPGQISAIRHGDVSLLAIQ
ncbi:MAG: biotin--[acetyl-CoA-carboxylase] ligase [Desulfarculus sp.]|nr:biotin--[acetyl-CoA-carboxylase] ligase [Desulfarculus sp.]